MRLWRRRDCPPASPPAAPTSGGCPARLERLQPICATLAVAGSSETGAKEKQSEETTTSSRSQGTNARSPTSNCLFLYLVSSSQAPTPSRCSPSPLAPLLGLSPAAGLAPRRSPSAPPSSACRSSRYNAHGLRGRMPQCASRHLGARSAANRPLLRCCSCRPAPARCRAGCRMASLPRTRPSPSAPTSSSSWSAGASQVGVAAATPAARCFCPPARNSWLLRLPAGRVEVLP